MHAEAGWSEDYCALVSDCFEVEAGNAGGHESALLHCSVTNGWTVIYH